MKKLSIICAGLLLLLLSESAFCQLLFHDGMEAENYGRSGYLKYGRSIINRQANPKYDSFGSYIMDGVRIYDWTEEKINSKHTTSSEAYSHLYKTNEIDEGEYFSNYLNNLVVLHETQKSFSTRFIAGNEVRVKFSPLTVDMAALNGVRWDMNFNQSNLTFISSRADLPMWFSKEYQNENLKNRLRPVYLTGAHVERQFGVFNIAANYVNTYRSDSSQSRASNSITGTIPYNPAAPEILVVKLEDGSRIDRGGPRMYDLYPVVNGKKRPDLLVGITKGSWDRDFTVVRKLDSPARDLYVNRYFLDPDRMPEYKNFQSADVRSLPDTFIMKRTDVTVTDAYNENANNIVDRYRQYFVEDVEGDYFEVNGSEYLQFWFQMPQDEEVTEVVFKSLVGNDYKFSVAEQYNVDNNDMATYFDTMKESPGNVKDMSNLKWVNFRYGQETANMLMGFRIDADIKDFKLIAEYNRNLTYRQYMNTGSKKFNTDSDAYYINLKKTFGNFTLGTEIFKIHPEYQTSYHNIDPMYDAMKVIPESTWENYFHNDISLQGGSDAPSGSSDSFGYMANTMVIDTVDDNDDKDRYPDFHLFTDVKDRNGIFPGMDKNGNDRPDTNENDNLIPDYAEPFLLYQADPDSYDYGDDLNNNGVIDEREDDDRPDYPYEIDSKGYHVFGQLGGDTGLRTTLGYYNFKNIYGGGKTDVRYGKLEYKKFIPFFAELQFASKLKKVEDSVQDNVFRHERMLSTTLIDSFSYVDNKFRSREGIQSEPFYDPLMYRDSYVSSSFFGAKLFRIPNLTVEMKLKYDLNHQNETSYQNRNDVIERTQILRADYRYYFNKLLITPQVKYMSRKYTSNLDLYSPFHETYFYPIIKMEYPLTMKTTFKAGVQGLPGLNAQVRNLVNSELNYDERHYLIMLTNQSLYQGYDFSLNFGYEINWQKFEGIMRKGYDRTDKIIFIRLVVGMEPIT